MTPIRLYFLRAACLDLLRDRDVFGGAPLITGQRYTSFTIARALMHLPVLCSHAGETPDEGAGLPETQSMPADFKTSVEQLVMSLVNDGYPSIVRGR